MSKIRDISFITCIFLSLAGIPLGFIDLYYYYIIVTLFFPILVWRHKMLERNLMFVLSYLCISGTLQVIFGNNDMFSFLKVLTSIFVYFWLFFLIIRDTNYDLVLLFKLYYKYSVITALIGMVQFLSFLIGFVPGYNYSWLGLRNIAASELAGLKVYPVHSILGEPAAFAVVMAPAMYIAISQLFGEKYDENYGKKWWSYIIISSYLLTQSSTGYITVLIIFILINLRKINFLRLAAFATLIPLIGVSLYIISPKFSDRLDSSIGLITGNIIADAAQKGQQTNGSSLVLFNHFLIAKSNAYDHPFGTGLGSHHVAFTRYNTLKTWFTGYGPGAIILNIHDANSLFSRILSETGYLGIVCTFLFIGRHFLRTGKYEFTIINHASLIIILASLLRGGPYFNFGLPFFIYCYYFSSIFSKKDENKK